MSQGSSNEASIKRLGELIADLEARLADLQKRLPAHSISPALIAEMDGLDEQLAEARAQLASLNVGKEN